MTRNELFRKIESEASVLGVERFCTNIARSILDSPVSNPVYSYSSIQEAAGGDCPLEQLQICINYLKAAPLCLLQQQYQYIDPDGIPHDLSRDDLRVALADGSLAHPEHGYTDSGFADRVYILFRADRSVIAND